jgi:hypothetical protein
MKLGDRVHTPDGPGVIVGIEPFKLTRYGVKLDTPTPGIPISYYFLREITKS